MTEEDDFKRVTKDVFDRVKAVDFSDKKSEVEKVEETERWLNDLDKQTENILKMLDSRIMFGKISQSEKNRMINEVIEIKNEYLNK